jgi:hypothetical protein
MILGCDISHYQAVQPVPAPVQFAWIKSSEGTRGAPDAHYAGHRKAFRDAGKPSGPYHFLRPAGDARWQARAWRACAGPLSDGDLRPAADIEVPGFTVPWLAAFLDEATKAFDATPVIYASLGYLPNLRGLEHYDLWVAAYRKVMPKPAGWNVVAWQNTDKGPMGGDGNLAPSLRPLLIGATGTTAPPTPPEVHPVTGSPRVGICVTNAGQTVVVFADGGVWCSPGGPHDAAALSCSGAIGGRGGKATGICALGPDGIAVLSEDGHVDTRFAAHPGNAI